MTVGERMLFEEAMAAKGWVKQDSGMWTYDDGDSFSHIDDEAARRHWLKWGGACEPIPF